MSIVNISIWQWWQQEEHMRTGEDGWHKHHTIMNSWHTWARRILSRIIFPNSQGPESGTVVTAEQIIIINQILVWQYAMSNFKPSIVICLLIAGPNKVCSVYLFVTYDCKSVQESLLKWSLHSHPPLTTAACRQNLEPGAWCLALVDAIC